MHQRSLKIQTGSATLSATLLLKLLVSYVDHDTSNVLQVVLGNMTYNSSVFSSLCIKSHLLHYLQRKVSGYL